jgi:hypothetical protein
MGWPSPRKMPKAKRAPVTTTAATLQETLEAAIEHVAAKVPAGPAQLGAAEGRGDRDAIGGRLRSGAPWRRCAAASAQWPATAARTAATRSVSLYLDPVDGASGGRRRGATRCPEPPKTEGIGTHIPSVRITVEHLSSGQPRAIELCRSSTGAAAWSCWTSRSLRLPRSAATTS